MKAAEKQPGNSGRDGRGHFTRGNRYAFRKGRSGNPAGRPKSITLSEAYRRELAKVDPEDPDGRTHAEVLAGRMIDRAKAGDVAALKEIADRVEGRAKQTVSLSYDRRERIERAVETMIREAGADGDEISREDALQALALFMPEAVTLIN